MRMGRWGSSGRGEWLGSGVGRGGVGLALLDWGWEMGNGGSGFEWRTGGFWGGWISRGWRWH